jgi:hypothetical protein
MESGRVRLREEICFWDERERGKVRGYIGGGAGNGSKQKFLVLMYTRATNGCMHTWNYLGFT